MNKVTRHTITAFQQCALWRIAGLELRRAKHVQRTVEYFLKAGTVKPAEAAVARE
jgi:hypothetical protein